jgi:hypothetical protein
MIHEAEDYCVEDKQFLRKAKVMNALDGRVYKMRSAMEKKCSLAYFW